MRSRRQRVEQVVRARLERQRRPAPGAQREVRAVPGEAAVVVHVEVVHALVQDGLAHRRVLAERPVHRRRAAPLRADDQEARQHPRRAVIRPAVTEIACAARLAGGDTDLLVAHGWPAPAPSPASMAGSSQVPGAPSRAPASACRSARYRTDRSAR